MELNVFFCCLMGQQQQQCTNQSHKKHTEWQMLKWKQKVWSKHGKKEPRKNGWANKIVIIYNGTLCHYQKKQQRF